ncbi:alpha/beta hydrolase [Phenylobacterium sp.]|uniref:alpha/beta hydrolase n=1 Tax=Phenylobacterium sp. TaxID=1871053 RepID=UPI00286DA7B6|nr:alpha/beta hydrolase [Phenylobacterium sp.]
MNDAKSANVALVIETMYQVAANPDAWRQLIDALADAGDLQEMPSEAVTDMARSLDIARLTARPEEGPVTSRRNDIGWIVLSARRKVLAANNLAHEMMDAGLGRLRLGAELAFQDPANGEALVRALNQSRAQASGQAILRLDRGREEGPCFAYVAPAPALPSVADAAAAELAGDDEAFALVFPAVEETGRLWASIRESFGLTPAELRLARKLRDGRSLKEAADELEVSVNTLRNQLRAIFDKMGLKRQSDLIRALTQLSSVASAIEAQTPVMIPAGADAPPVVAITLRDGRRLAYRDYGEPEGRAVLFFHEGMGSSLLPPGAQGLACELNLRLICAERPGFGQSDPSPDYSFDSVADDMVELCDQLGLTDVRISAILSGAPSAMQTAVRLGRRAAGVLLCSGRPPRPVSEARTRNPLTLFRSRIENNPWVIETFYAILRLRLSAQLVDRIVRGSTAHSPGDAAYFAQNAHIATYIATYVGEALARTSRGAADEVKAFRRARNLTVAELSCPLEVWHGEEDVFAPLADLLDYLGDKPREVRVIPGIGHLMALKHWDEVLRRSAA